MSDETPKTKVELMSEMRRLQAAYSEVAGQLKQLTFAEEKVQREVRQLERLERYKSKYSLYANDDGTTKAIDWEEVEKLIKTSFNSDTVSYGLGFDQNGMEGLGYDYGTGKQFQPMVEDDTDARRYFEREKLRQEFTEKSKKGK